MSILQSIKPKYCELIASGKKTIEVRKTRPKCELPVKVHIYCTKDKWQHLVQMPDKTYRLYNGKEYGKFDKSLKFSNEANGKVIGEYVCDEIIEIPFDNEYTKSYDISDDDLHLTCLTQEQLWKYGKGKTLYIWHISDLVIYDKPKELSEFLKYGFGDAYSSWEDLFAIGVNGCGTVIYPPEPKEDDWRLTHPPLSWCYVEEV